MGYFSFDTAMTATTSDANEIISDNASATVIIQQPPLSSRELPLPTLHQTVHLYSIIFVPSNQYVLENLGRSVIA
ncbi:MULTISPECIES: hypothetical protein [Geobacillus]|uniref:hypothetical protein n=1 Tax=Geobacillus proteiniphilus TaxID=860353 RepID=UPI001428C49E|nr:MULTISPECIES: hypothetical protein [Geobacillus]WJQ10417.1 hypothetical protein QT237_17240 [Geobacillus stearothermophilus]